MTNKTTPKAEHAFPEWDDALAEVDGPTGFVRGCLFALPLSLALWALIGLAIWLALR